MLCTLLKLFDLHQYSTSGMKENLPKLMANFPFRVWQPQCGIDYLERYEQMAIMELLLDIVSALKLFNVLY